MYGHRYQTSWPLYGRKDNNLSFKTFTNNCFLLDSSNIIEKLKESDIKDPKTIFLSYYDEKKNIIVEKRFKIENFKNLYDFSNVIVDGKPVGFLMPKQKLANQNKIDLLTKEIKNSKFNDYFLKMLKLDLNKDIFDLEKTNDVNTFILKKKNNNNMFYENQNKGNNYTMINNNQNRIFSNKDEMQRNKNDQLNKNDNDYAQNFSNNRINNNKWQL